MNDNKTEAVMYQDENCDYKIAIGPEYLGNWDYVFAVHYVNATIMPCSGSVQRYNLKEKGFEIELTSEGMHKTVFFQTRVLDLSSIGTEILREVCQRLTYPQS